MPFFSDRSAARFSALTYASVALAIILGTRAWLYWYYGVLIWPDTSTYLGPARNILVAPDWLAAARGLPVFRAIGYPFFLAGAEALAGPAWYHCIVGLQVGMAVLCFYALFRLGRAYRLPHGWAILPGTLYLLSHITLFDLSILTDSLFSHLFVIALCIFLLPLLKESNTGWWWRSLAGGCLFAVATIIREATIYLLPIIIIATAMLAIGSSLTWRTTITASILFVLPALLVWQGYLGWNQARTGHRFITTVGKYVYLIHPLQVEYRGTKVFTDPVLREAFAATSSDYTYGHARAIDAYLLSHRNIQEYDRLTMAQNAYWTAWYVAPVAMAREMLKEFRPKHALQLVSPTMPFRDYPMLLGQGNSFSFTKFLRSLPDEWRSQSWKGRAWLTLSLVVEFTFLIISAVIFSACIIGIPLLILRPGLRRALRGVLLQGLVLFWLLYIGMSCMYALIHVEMRYSLPVQSLAILSGVVVIFNLVHLYREARHGRHHRSESLPEI